LINQENYLRKVPSLEVIIESTDGKILINKVFKFGSNEFFDYLEIKDFEVKFSQFPENASNIFVEIIE